MYEAHLVFECPSIGVHRRCTCRTLTQVGNQLGDPVATARTIDGAAYKWNR